MNIPHPLLDDIAAGKCLPFIGAGFSLNARLPSEAKMLDWPALTKHLAQLVDVPSKIGGPKVASAYEKTFGRVQLIETIRHALHTDIIEPGDAHLAFAQLPFETIYTTNFDLLLEEANNQIKKPYRSLVGELQMPFHGGPLTTNIVKMHGDLRHEEHMITAQEDYDKFLEEYPVISTHLSAMLITRTGLFIGYSLSDPDFQHVRDVIRSRLGRFERMSYIIQFNQTKAKVKSMLDDNLHVINLAAKKNQKRDIILADFFGKIQKELDVRAGRRLRDAKPDIFEPVSQDTFEASSRAPDSFALLASSSNLCFVLMPFGEPFDTVYRKVVKPKIIEAGLTPLRADEMFTPGSIMEQIRSAIQQSRICIADLTGRNPNVLYELGIAQAIGKPTVLMTQDISDVPFDVAHYRMITYDPKDIKNLNRVQKELSITLQNVLGQDRLDEASNLIQNGMLRAGVAILGVLLEHSLKHIIYKNNLFDSQIGVYAPRPIGMGRMLQLLIKAEILSKDEGNVLKTCVEIRNRAVHELTEPSRKDALHIMEHVESLIKKHIGDAEQIT
jgi:SIR2-like domain/Domain of unknown function (DUF4145)